MKILAFVDMHGSLSALKKIKNKAKGADIIVCGGDFSVFEQGADYFLSEFNKMKKDFLIIHGNHEDGVYLKKHCERYKNLHFIHKQSFVKDDVLFIGWGGGGFSLRDKRLEKHSKKFKKIIKENKDKAVVLVTHAPPYKTRLDDLGGEPAGSKSLRNFIKETKIDLIIAGHLHENSNTQDKIGESTAINPGPEGRLIRI